MPTSTYDHRAYRKEYEKIVKYTSLAIPVDEFEEIKREATKLGIKPAVYMRELIRSRHSQQPVMPSTLQAELKRVSLLIRNVANNVNQIAKHSNQLKRLVDGEGLISQLKTLEKAVTDYTTNKFKNT